MSHQTGIKANEELQKCFAKCRTGWVRTIKVIISNEALALAHLNESVEGSTWERCYDKLVLPLLEEDRPCYILYRLDSRNEMGFEWLFISWSPDISPIREKMLYASTKATLKHEFGSAQIKEELYGTVKSDVTLEGYKKYITAAVSPAPLTTREEELQEIKRSEVCTDYGIDSKHQTLSGVAFPITETAKQAILDMAQDSYNYLQFKIDIEEEKIHLVTAENISIETLASKVPDNTPRYHLYKFKHTHEGDYLENIVFIYSMPGYNCSIKERMLYSSCKNPLTDIITSLDLQIVKKLEIDSSEELTEAFLYGEIHPTLSLHRPKFAKPKGPPGRGPKRMVKTQQAN